MMYHIHATQGQGGGRTGDAFPSLDEALAYVEDQKGQASFAIEYPDGSFHQWTEN